MTNNKGTGKTVRLIFSPAIALLNRMNYTRKFTLLWLMSLIAVAIVVYSLFASLDRVIQPSRRELEGLVLIEPVSRTVQMIQRHRGVSAALLAGNETMKDKRAAREREAAAAFTAMEEVLPPGLTSSEGFRLLKADWGRLREEGLHWTLDENFAAHTRLVAQIQSLESSVADEYALTLDGELATFYLIDTSVNRLPHVLEHLGQLRAYGTGILAGKQITARQEIKLNNLIAELDSSLNELETSIGKTVRHNPAVRDSLLNAYGGIADSARKVSGLVTADILTGRFATSPEVFLDLATAEIDRGYAQMYESLLPTTRTLIEKRIAKAKNTLLTSVAGALLIFLLVVYTSVSIYYAIIGSIQSLVRSAHTFAEGNLDARVKLDTCDEISHIGDSFNKMADGFNALLEERKRAEQALYESEKIYRSLFENMLNGFAYCQMIFEQDQPQDFIYLSVNAAFEMQTGLKNVVGKRVSEVIPGIRQSDPELFKVYGRVALSGKSERLEIYLTSLQQWFWISVYSPGKGYFVAVFDVITERKQAENALRKSKDLLQSVVENAPVHIFWKDRDSRYLGCNTQFAKAAGYASSDEVAGKTDFEMWRKDLAELYRADDKAVMESGIAKLDYEEPGTTPGGNTIWARTSKVPLRDESNQVIGILGIYEDITERKQAEQVVLESQKRLGAIIETALDAVVQMDAEGIITGWNPQAEKTFGWSKEEAIGRAMDETIIPPQYREAHTQGLKRFLATGEGAILNSQIELQALHRDGHEFPVELSIVPLKTANQYEFSAFINDITSRKKSEDLIWKQANFDELTGLPNRHMFYDRLAQEIRKADRTSLSMALLYIDLDRFKEINDTLGHSMGDILLVDASHRISACVRETDTVARLGGDEFIVVLTELNEVSRIDALTQNILHELAQPFRLGHEVAYLTASIGITLYPHDAAGMEELVKNADQAMYAAKNAGRNRFSYFTQAMQQTAQAKLKLSNDLRGALAARQFKVYYQPIVELATGRIHKAEALIRWQHPVRGLVSPAEFIPLTEESGLIVEIGDWVFREAASQVKRWRTLYDPEFQISVNVSPVQFYSTSNPHQTWLACLQELDLPGQSMVIEITEGLLLEAEQGVIDKLLRFHEAGIQISLDDFGTGYSSLSYLRKFDIDYLKIDQSFTRNLAPDSSSMALSEAIIMMAHRLDMTVIAEGVETAAQRDLLANAGCNYAQGYLISRPVTAEAFEDLLKGALTGDSRT